MLQPIDRSARRLAVALHNRKHRFPLGVLLIVFVVAALGVVAYFSTQENPEIKRLREETKKTHQKLQHEIDEHYRELKESREESERKFQADIDRIVGGEAREDQKE